MTEESSMSKEEVKISQAEAAKKLLAQKKQMKANAQAVQNQKGGNQMMKSQNTKKINNQRKRMGV